MNTKLDIPQTGSFVCEYSRFSTHYQPVLNFYKQAVSQQLQDQTHKEKFKSLNQVLNARMDQMTKTIISFIEMTTKVDVKQIWIKFLEDKSGEVYFNGVTFDLYYLVKGPQEKDSPPKTLINESLVFAGTKIKVDKNNWLQSSVLPVCSGEYCEYEFNDNHKFLSYRGKKKEFERNFSMIPEKNLVFNVICIYLLINLIEQLSL